MSDRTPRTVAWWEPRWSFMPRQWDAWRRAGVTKRFWIRTTGIGAALTLAFVLIVPVLAPGAVLPAWRLAMVPFAFPGYLAIMLGLELMIPPRVKVSRKHVSIVHGQRSIAIPSDRLLESTINASDPARAMLTIRYATRRGERTRAIGIAAGVDLDALACSLDQMRQIAARPPSARA